MRQMEGAWNTNIADRFNLSFIIVLGKSILEWLNKYDHGFMCIGLET